MIKVGKYEALKTLSKIDDVVFVGGASEYLQGVKGELRDIDISVTDAGSIQSIGYLHTSKDNAFYGLSGNRGFIPLESVLIDVFIDLCKPDYITVNGFRCQTLSSMLLMQEETLKHNRERLSDHFLEKIEINIKRLKLWLR